MKYEIILFDADETLFDFKKSERIAFENTCRAFGIEYDESYHFRVYKEINTAVWQELAEGRISQKELNQERFKRFSKKISAGFQELEFAGEYIEQLSHASFVYEDSIPVIRSLSRSCRLAIVSNGLKKVQDGRIRKSTIAEYFEEIIISDEVGILKPDPAIFELALTKMNCIDKRTALMVGDSLTTDVQGGINSGIDTCWFNPLKSGKPDGLSAIEPTYEISGLSELLDIIG